MAQYTKQFPTLKITTSNSNAIAGLEDLDGLAIFCTTSSGVFTVQVAASTDGTDFADLQSAGADVTITAPNVLTISPIAFRQLRLASTQGSTGSASTGVSGDGFKVVGTFQVN